MRARIIRVKTVGFICVGEGQSALSPLKLPGRTQMFEEMDEHIIDIYYLHLLPSSITCYNNE